MHYLHRHIEQQILESGKYFKAILLEEISHGLVIYLGKEIFKLDEHTTAIPWNLL